MAEFKSANDYTLKYEGGWNADLDGGTYCGITHNNFPNWSGWKLLRNYNLSTGEVVNNPDLQSLVNSFYFLNFWQAIRGNSIDSQEVASYLYDWKVNSGSYAIKAVQSIVGVDDDGVFGSYTLGAINSYGGELLKELHGARIAFYQRIGVGEKAKFLKGWLKRANDLYSKLQIA